MPPKPIAVDIETVRRLANQGKSSREIGDELGFRPKQIQWYMQQNGIRGLSRGQQKGRRRPILNIDEDRAKELYRSGMTCQQVASELNVTGYKPEETIRRRLKNVGVKRRIGKAVGENNPQWRDGRSATRPDRENRYECYRVVVGFLGMLLPTGWVVHHIDENPANNSLSNLALFPSGRTHLKYHQWLLAHQLQSDSVEAIRAVSENDGRLLLSLPDRNAAEPDTSLLSLLRTECQRVGTRTKWKHLIDPGYLPWRRHRS